MAAVSSPLAASPAPLEASFRALVRQSEAVVFRDGTGCIVCLRQGKLMENHFVCVSQPPAFQGHKKASV